MIITITKEIQSKISKLNSQDKEIVLEEAGCLCGDSDALLSYFEEIEILPNFDPWDGNHNEICKSIESHMVTRAIEDLKL